MTGSRWAATSRAGSERRIVDDSTTSRTARNTATRSSSSTAVCDTRFDGATRAQASEINSEGFDQWR